MKRRAFQVVMFLLLGAIVNVAVAWGIAGNVKVFAPALIKPPTPDDQRSWSKWRKTEFGESAAFASDVKLNGFSLQQVSGARKPNTFGVEYKSDGTAVLGGGSTYWPGTVFGDCVRSYSSGWPRLSMVGIRRETRVQPGRQPDGSTITQFRNGYYIDDHWLLKPPVQGDTTFVAAIPITITFDAIPYYFVLPCMPLWPGFAINTLFYAAVLCVLFSAPGFVRRRRRIKRGLCPVCAYPVGTSPVCTECGKAVTSKTKP